MINITEVVISLLKLFIAYRIIIAAYYLIKGASILFIELCKAWRR